MEYGSARWGTAKDIELFVDEDQKNNVILTKTESLTMNSRPSEPKNARNKNVLIVGGSGSGTAMKHGTKTVMKTGTRKSRVAKV